MVLANYNDISRNHARSYILQHKHTHQHLLCFFVDSAGPLYVWSMFPAEDTWNWLMNNNRNTASAPATMHFSWQDNQFSAMWHLKTLNSQKAKYYHREKWINDPDMIDISVAGTQTVSSFGQLEHAELILFYIASWPLLGNVWEEAVQLFGDSCDTTADLRAVGLERHGAGLYRFESKLDVWRFYCLHFAGKAQDI